MKSEAEPWSYLGGPADTVAQVENRSVKMALPEVDMVHVRRVLRVGATVLAVLLGLAIILGMVKPYADYLWFAHDVHQPQVFTTMYDAR